MVQEESTLCVAYEKGEDGEAWDVVRTHYHQLLHPFPLAEHVAAQVLLQGHDDITPHCLLELHGQPRPHGTHDGGRAPFLPSLRLRVIAVLTLSHLECMELLSA